MNYAFVVKLIALLVVVGGIFLTGALVGGAFATGTTQQGALRQVEHCLPAQSAEQLRPCLAPDTVDDEERGDG